MLTLLLETPGKLIATETPQPDSPGPKEALVRIHRIGVCGTDLHAYAGRQPFFTYPRILGHELGVEVVAIGSEVTTVAVGDRCAVEPYLNCGHCIACTRGKPNCCHTLQVLGVHTDGGHRSHMLVPAAKLHRSTKLTYDQLALVETLGIGAHAVGRAKLEAGEYVAVIGAGPIGLAIMQFARAAGARVIAVDVSASRLTFCRDRIGVDAVVDARQGDVAEQLGKLTDGNLPTAVFEATGNVQSMNTSFNFPAPGGRLILVGLVQADVTFHDPHFHKRELTVLSSRNALPSEFTAIIQLIENGKIDTGPWITHRAKLGEVTAQFESWTKPATGVIKAMIEVPAD
jgi:2-desacetyl-2-hydroxyethyl bacteriochlorophyllide A dehydrogenase|uniref:zinc-binding alcohol dehydrogenase family protein n=1 Tax=Cephaloticoccus sp. TaxID=1985742 RepID=UPI0040492868